MRIFALAVAVFWTMFPVMAEEKAIVGGGCFWCVEAVYQGRPGIKSVVSGYAGGEKANPTYEEVSSGRTGHAEVVEITFDPAQISYEKVIDLFWDAHDPTTLNRQGADVGTQYRSIIIPLNDEQRALAEKSKAAAQAKFKDPIVTEITATFPFFPAEEYHQDFYEQNPAHPYNRAVIAPKLEKLRKSGL
ncbi:MAG: peptide-methionine (S)-S-oxide reductase MsrA [Terrimicrobiaceae bacterium]|nr:peptide-methionine (S)-S-oxide reductase MsrA [Terrimicrobiaceae bacterium]